MGCMRFIGCWRKHWGSRKAEVESREGVVKGESRAALVEDRCFFISVLGTLLITFLPRPQVQWRLEAQGFP
jgi:hypothetical protein